MNPPAYRKQLGRPKKGRRMEHEEVFPAGHKKISRVYDKIQCKICGKEGHNSSTCTNRASIS